MAGPKFGALTQLRAPRQQVQEESPPFPHRRHPLVLLHRWVRGPRAVPPESGAMRNGITPIYCCASRRKIRQSQA